jgi:hypothetical protein
MRKLVKSFIFNCGTRGDTRFGDQRIIINAPPPVFTQNHQTIRKQGASSNGRAIARRPAILENKGDCSPLIALVKSQCLAALVCKIPA